ncbi:MAG: hypothetical protein GY822_07335 [Deltaproteobacteria bacterium]|nr:hypothetical protein [Deltaproteobacteria bacterium]
MNAQRLAQVGYENYHQMLSDSARNRAYRAAIFEKVKPGDVVIDLGAGTGLLSIWAVQAGAQKVYAIEKTDSIHLAKEIARTNGCADKIVFLNENSVDVELPERANVLLSETLGSFGIDENTLHFTADVKRRLLTDDATLIPQSLDLFAAPFSDAKAYEKLDFWRQIPGVDFTPAFELFSRKIMVETVEKKGLLAEPIRLAEIDFRENFAEEFCDTFQFRMQKSGTLHGIAAWFRVVLCDGIEISTSPKHPQTHWKQAFFPFRDSISVVKGDILEWSVDVDSVRHDSDDTTISYDYRCTQLNNEVKRPSLAVGRNDPCSCGSGLKSKKCCNR